VSCTHDWGDKALQECNLSTQFVRCLQEKQTPGSALAGSGLFSMLLQTRSKAKNSSSLSSGASSPLLGRSGAGLLIAGLSAQYRPDKAAELTRDGDFSFVTLKASAQEFHKAQV
jgi:hypothetical protein